MKKALFLDRDGVINEDFGYVYKVDDFCFIDDIFELCTHFQASGYKIIIITNQSGVERGYYTKDDFYKLSEYMCDEFLKRGIKIDDIYASFGFDEDRKPSPNMFLKAAKKHSIDLENSIMIGDKLSDMQAGQNAGIKKLYLVGDKDQTQGNFYKIAKKYEDIIKENL